jgi:hypothetical protein
MNEYCRVSDLTMAGRDIRATEARLLESVLEKHPEDFDTRMKVIGFYFGRGLLKSDPVPLASHAAGGVRQTGHAEDAEIVQAKQELLLYALHHDNMLQTVLSISECPFGVVLGERLYKGEEEVLLFVEALKRLILDGLVDGYFERASKSHSLTYEGLKVAKKLESELSSDSNHMRQNGRQQHSASEVANLAAVCTSDLETIRAFLAQASARISALNNLPPGLCRTDRQGEFVIHFYHPNFNCSVQFRYFGAPHAGQDPGLRLLFTGDRVYDLKPYLVGTQIAWCGSDDRQIGDAHAVGEFILSLITNKEFVKD